MPNSSLAPRPSLRLLWAVAAAVAVIGALSLVHTEPAPPPAAAELALPDSPVDIEFRGQFRLTLAPPGESPPAESPRDLDLNVPNLERGIYRTLFERGQPDDIGVDALLLAGIAEEHTETCPKGICVQGGPEALSRKNWVINALREPVNGVLAAPYLPAGVHDDLERIFLRMEKGVAAASPPVGGHPVRVFGFSQTRHELGAGKRTVALAIYDHTDPFFDGPDAMKAAHGGAHLLLARTEGPPGEGGARPILAGLVQFEERPEVPVEAVPETREAAVVHSLVGGLYVHFTNGRGRVHRFCFTESGNLLYFPPGGKPPEPLPTDGALARALRALIDRV